MFGISCAPEIFQRILEQILSGCDGWLNYIDDILIFGQTKELLQQRVEAVLAKFREYNVILNKDKCIFEAEEIEFLGHKLSARGITTVHDKVEAIKRFRQPATADEVRSFLGLVNYMGKFIPDLATLSAPLRILTKKDEKFNWTTTQDKAFMTLKNALAKEKVLGYYSVDDRTQLIMNASPVGCTNTDRRHRTASNIFR